ncbi:MAG: HAMP domain-containing histidine kinase, partial [Tolypothrix sp. T3-bin4]|nr:HAMP domain-containing histidine kinase [Tolypothrix sp. T3-bin4]
TVAHDLRTSAMRNLMVLKNLLNQGVGSGVAGEQGSRGAGEQGSRGKITASLSPLPPIPSAPQPLSYAQSSIPVSRSIIERMIQGNDRQLTMINSLLEINSCEKQGIDIKHEAVQLSTLLKGTFVQLEPMLTQNQATLKNLVPADLPLVMADATRLQKVVANLVTHSLQNNPPGLNFILSASVEGGMIRTQIQDDGVVMSKLECDRLFDLHVRDPQDCCSTSIGLKMYLCRKVIKAHGGEIGVISNRKRGLTFWFTLPLFTSSTTNCP